MANIRHCVLKVTATENRLATATAANAAAVDEPWAALYDHLQVLGADALRVGRACDGTARVLVYIHINRGVTAQSVRRAIARFEDTGSRWSLLVAPEFGDDGVLTANDTAAQRYTSLLPLRIHCNSSALRASDFAQ